MSISWVPSSPLTRHTLMDTMSENPHAAAGQLSCRVDGHRGLHQPSSPHDLHLSENKIGMEKFSDEAFGAQKFVSLNL